MLYIIRHGRTDWNDEMRLQGQTDIPLNDDGRRMAEEAAGRYGKIHFDLAFCSPLLRAKETAEILLWGRDIPIYFDDRLKEMAFGVCEGAKDYRTDPACPVSLLFRDPEAYDPPEGAESLDELFERTGAFLEERVLPLVREGKDVLIVGHGAMNSAIICRMAGLSRKDFWSAGIENCELKRIG
ncbi:MAG: histidine phosphatase family protein [Lachnospiraceae bacterium]|nr:histidine phosphatase family protein [Lachnospiraceae bacterium]